MPLQAGLQRVKQKQVTSGNTSATANIDRSRYQELRDVNYQSSNRVGGAVNAPAAIQMETDPSASWIGEGLQKLSGVAQGFAQQEFKDKLNREAIRASNAKNTFSTGLKSLMANPRLTQAELTEGISKLKEEAYSGLQLRDSVMHSLTNDIDQLSANTEVTWQTDQQLKAEENENFEFQANNANNVVSGALSADQWFSMNSELVRSGESTEATKRLDLENAMMIASKNPAFAQKLLEASEDNLPAYQRMILEQQLVKKEKTDHIQKFKDIQAANRELAEIITAPDSNITMESLENLVAYKATSIGQEAAVGSMYTKALSKLEARDKLISDKSTWTTGNPSDLDSKSLADAQDSVMNDMIQGGMTPIAADEAMAIRSMDTGVPVVRHQELVKSASNVIFTGKPIQSIEDVPSDVRNTLKLMNMYRFNGGLKSLGMTEENTERMRLLSALTRNGGNTVEGINKIKRVAMNPKAFSRALNSAEQRKLRSDIVNNITEDSDRWFSWDTPVDNIGVAAEEVSLIASFNVLNGAEPDKAVELARESVRENYRSINGTAINMRPIMGASGMQLTAEAAADKANQRLKQFAGYIGLDADTVSLEFQSEGYYRVVDKETRVNLDKDGQLLFLTPQDLLGETSANKDWREFEYQERR